MTAGQSCELERLLELVSSKVGVIRSLVPVVRGAEEPNPPLIYQANLSHFDFREAKSWERVAVGKGMDEAEAMRGAIGEAIEHYCASHFDENATRRARWTAVRSEALPPTECVLYSEKQYARPGFRYRPWSPDDELRWLPMTELPSLRQLLVPATCVYLSLSDVQPQDLFCAPTSNGLAAGLNLDFALLHSLYEVIERDAFLATWMNRLPVPEVELAGVQGKARLIWEHYCRFGVELHVFNISTELPAYVMMSLAVDRSGDGPALVVGLGCDLDPTLAITKALLELCQVRPAEIQRCHRDRPGQRLQSYQDVRTLEDHSAFFHPVERLCEFSFLLENGRVQHIKELATRSLGDVAADLKTCVAALTAAGSRVFYADLTTADVAPYGFRVVRTIATGLQPMHFGFGEERLGGRRLFEIPKLLGYSPCARGEDDINPAPHPLA